MRIVASFLALVGAVSLLATLQPIAFGVLALSVAGAGLGAANRRRGAAVGLVLGLGLGLLRPAVFDGEPETLALKSLEPGQYVARSDDPLHLVLARVVVRGEGRLIFAEAHGLVPMGLDRGTLYGRPHEWLFYQAQPPEISERHDEATARLVDLALAKALSGEARREEPRLPEGARVEGDKNTYWDMFPDEFDHRCAFTGVADGTYRGTSSNPAWSVEVEVDVLDQHPRDVRVVRRWSSAHGERAFEELPQRIVDARSTDVDIVSGATRSSLLVRSAAFHACKAAGGLVASQQDP